MSDMIRLAEIRERVARYQANPNSVDASADMAACCDTDLAALLARYDALLVALADVEQQIRATADAWAHAQDRTGHYDDFDAGSTHAKERAAEKVSEWADQLRALRKEHGGE